MGAFSWPTMASIMLGLLNISIASACQPEPLLIPIEDVLLANGQAIRGISLGVGTPGQNISLLASAGRNETYIYGTNGVCDDLFSQKGCFTYRGGQYDRNSSTSEEPTEEKGSDTVDALWVMDAIRMSPNVSLDDFGFGIPNKDLDSGYKGQAQLGLGRNSSLLNALIEAGKIGSRTFSMFWGLVGGPSDQQTQGSLILGGIDQEIMGTAGENFTTSLNYQSNCMTGMLVTINDIALNWPNGSDSSIFMGVQSAVIQACIVPDFAGLITLPITYWENFRMLAGGRYPGDVESRAGGINYQTMLYQPKDVYYGDLTISLQNSISIRIPNTELVTADRYVSPSSGDILTNHTVRDIVINPIQDINRNDLPIIGRLFLSSAYLSVNYDAQAFSIWQADVRTPKRSLMAVDSTNALVQTFCEKHNRTDEPTEGASSPSSTPSLGKPDRLSGATIAGVVVGVTVIAAIIGAVGYVLLRRNTRKRNAATTNDGPPSALDRPPTPAYHSRPQLLAIPSELPDSLAKTKDENAELE